MRYEVDYLIVGINYFPEPTGNAPYTTDLAEHLSARNNVRVITGIPHYPWWEKRRVDVASLRENLEVIRRNHYVPRSQSLFRRALMEFSFALAVIFGGKLKAKKTILVSPAMISSALILFWLRLWGRKRKVIVWVQDLYEQGIRETGGKESWPARLVASLERWMLRNSSHIVFAHKGFANLQEDLEDSKISCVPNWSHFVYRPDMPKVVSFEGRIVLHIGNMGVKQGLENVISAAKLAESQNEKVLFLLVGAGNQIQNLQTLAGNCSAVRFVPPVSEQDLSGYLNSADILLVNEKPGVKEMSIPSKLTTYFQTGVPVLVCSEADSLAAQEVLGKELGSWVKSGNPLQLLEAVTKLDLDQQRVSAKRARSYSKLVLGRSAVLERFRNILEKV